MLETIVGSWITKAVLLSAAMWAMKMFYEHVEIHLEIYVKSQEKNDDGNPPIQ